MRAAPGLTMMSQESRIIAAHRSQGDPIGYRPLIFSILPILAFGSLSRFVGARGRANRSQPTRGRLGGSNAQRAAIRSFSQRLKPTRSENKRRRARSTRHSRR